MNPQKKYAEKRIVATCPVCGESFIKRSFSHKYCNKECWKVANRRRSRLYAQNKPKKRDDFTEGEIWILDMDSWEWGLEIRGD